VRLQGKSALITGAGSGIGRAIALAYAREGAKIALTGRRQHTLEETARLTGQTGVLIVPGDVRKPKDIEGMIQGTVELFGRLDALVCNAGVLLPGTADTQTEADWDTTFDVNVKAVWRLARAALPHLRRAGGGSIINVSSVVGLIAARNRLAYSASKGAVTLLTKAMAVDLGPENIRVNCICPGIVETELVADFVRRAPDPAEARRKRELLHAIPRIGQPEDIAGCAVFLASDESRWLTGAAIPVDGGYLAGKA
jgi:NAD(P)-dependent dehydrogenase (short-subunit alcohol dehydrogenase family)